MKKTFTAALAVLALGATLAIAAPGEGGKHNGDGGKYGRRGGLDKRLEAKLDLTAAQKTQIDKLRTDFREQNKALLEEVKQAREAIRTARQAGDQAKVDSLLAAAKTPHEQLGAKQDILDQQILAVLTAEQRAKVDAMKQKLEDRRNNRNHDNHD